MAALAQTAVHESLSGELIPKDLSLSSQMGNARAQIWQTAQELPYTVTVDIEISNFTIGDLLRLEVGTVIETQWSQGMDLPLRANGEVIGWAEFEVMGDQLAVRLTDLE